MQAGLTDRIKAAVDAFKQAYQTLVALHNGDDQAVMKSLQSYQAAANNAGAQQVLSGQK